jgi:hypothetical protein
MTGSLTVTGSATFSSSVTANNFIASGGDNTFVLNAGIATTGWQQIAMTNTSGSTLLGVEGSAAGTLATGTTAYASILRNYTNTALQFATNNIVRATITSAGNVGIGTNSPLTKLDIRGTSASSDATLQIVGNGISTLLLGQNSRGGAIRGQGGSDELSFWTGGTGDTGAASSGTERMRITSAGVKFANGASSLNYYEEGTFTPVLAFGGNSVGITYSIQNGTYTRVGRIVNISFRIILTSRGSSTGAAQIKNLPFIAANITGNFGGFTLAFADSMSSFAQTLMFVGDTNSNDIQIRYINGSNYVNFTETNFPNNANFIITGTYQTS